MELEAIRHRMAEIKRAVDEIVGEIEVGSINGAINWADLGCGDVEFVITEYHDGIYRAVIDEAAPGNTDLTTLVIRKLYLRGYHDVEVVCEW